MDTKNAVAWPRTPGGELVLDPLQPVSSVFTGFPSDMANLTLVDGLGLGGGGLEALLRHAISGLLNAIHPWVTYPLSAPEVIALTNAAVASGDVTIESLKNRLQGYNELGSDLDANGRVPPPTLSVGGVSVAEGQTGSSSVLGDRLALEPGNQCGQRQLGHGQRHCHRRKRLPRRVRVGLVRAWRQHQDRAITILGDGVVEPRDLHGAANNAAGAAISTGTATVTITNDDAQPVVTVTASARRRPPRPVGEHDRPSRSRAPASSSGHRSRSNLAVRTGTAVFGADYTLTVVRPARSPRTASLRFTAWPSARPR